MKISFTTGRLGTETVYHPAYNDGSKDVSQRLTFSVAIHDYRKKDGADFVDMTIWGNYADTMVRLLCPGSFVVIMGRDKPYPSKIRDQVTGSYIVNSQGVPAVSKKAQGTNVIELEAVPGTESRRRVAEEIQNYINGNFSNPFAIRPPQWDVENTQDAMAWSRIWEDRKKETKYHPGMTTFGYARVQMPNQGRIIAQPQNVQVYPNQPAAPVYPNQPPAPVYPNQPQPQNQWANPGTAQPMQQYANQYTNLQPQPQTMNPQPQQNQQFDAQQNSWAQQPQQQNVQPQQQNDFGF